MRFTRRDFLKWAAVTLGSTATIGLLGYIWARKIEPELLEETRLDLTLPRLAPEFEGYRIYHISDLHMSEWMDHDRLANIASRINASQPDLVVITGDFVTHDPEWYATDLVPALSSLQTGDGALAILGNHDHWAGAEAVRMILRDSGIMELRNTVRTIARGEALLHIAGVDDMMVREDCLECVLQQLPTDGCAILLAHEPAFADQSACTERFDLQLSGHSHGGQVVLPLIGAPFLPAYADKYTSGLYKVGEMYQYTSRGLGMVHIGVRFNCPPEMTLLTLHSPQFSAEAA